MSGSGQCPSLKRKFIFVLSLEAIATLAFVRDGGWKYYAHRKDHLQVDQIDRLDPIWYLVCRYDILGRIFIVQMRPRKHVLDRSKDGTTPSRQHDLL